jgi:hypothetical protein
VIKEIRGDSILQEWVTVDENGIGLLLVLCQFQQYTWLYFSKI